MKKVLTLVLAMCASLAASTISFSHTTQTGTAPFTDNFTLQKFDSTLGALTNILITFATSTTAEVDIFNGTGFTQSFTNATSSVPLTLTGPAGTTVNTTAVAGPFNGTLSPAIAATAFPGITSNNSTNFTVLPANFGSYTGSGTTTTAFSVVAGGGTFAGTANPGVFFGGSATAGSVSTITYTFTPTFGTPEPATMGLLGSALIGLGFLKFRTQKS